MTFHVYKPVFVSEHSIKKLQASVENLQVSVKTIVTKKILFTFLRSGWPLVQLSFLRINLTKLMSHNFNLTAADRNRKSPTFKRIWWIHLTSFETESKNEILSILGCFNYYRIVYPVSVLTKLSYVQKEPNSDNVVFAVRSKIWNERLCLHLTVTKFSISIMINKHACKMWARINFFTKDPVDQLQNTS